jgi:hypothetical protein
MSNNRSGFGYVQLRKEAGLRLRVVKTTQNPPEVVEAGCIVVKVRFEAPDTAWTCPEVTVVVPVDLPVMQADPLPAEQ